MTTQVKREGTLMDEALEEVARICRKGINAAVYGGQAPNDSNALSEVWPTRLGFAFTGERHGTKFAVMICTEAAAPERAVRPDYG